MSTVVVNNGGPTPEEPASELNPGDCLAGRYRILGVLGTGGMSTVYRANDLRLKRDVAIKVVLPELRRNWKTLQRFMREAQAMATIDSPRVVPVYDVGQDGERYFMVMKLVQATSLDELIDKGPLEEPRAISIVIGVVEGLRDLHAKGIVHRDVKPSNIVVDDQDRPMLLDFGIVLEVGEPSLTNEGMLVGTPHYMAPEQIFTPTDVDGRADLYAVGVLLFETLTGKLPYGGNTPQALMKNHLTREVPDPTALAPNLSKETTAIVRRALTKDPDQRYQSADDLLKALRAVSDVESSDTAELPQTVEPQPPGRDHFVFALVGAALLGLAVFVIAAPMFERKSEPIFAEVKPLPPPAAPPQAAAQPQVAAPPPPPPVIAPPPVDPAPPEEKVVAKSRKAKPAEKVKEKEKEKIFLAALPSNDVTVKQAQALLHSGDVRAAIRMLDGVIVKNPKSPAPYPTLGDAYALIGNKNGAIAAYRRYLALSPHGAEAKRVEAALVRLGGRAP